MQLAFEWLSLALFFLVFKLSGSLNWATVCITITTLLQLLYHKHRHGSYQKMQLVSFALLVIMGAASFFAKNEIFIKCKPTLLYWVLALILVFMQYVRRRYLVQAMLEKHVQLPLAVWRQLNMAWVWFLLGMGALNLYVVYNFDTNDWLKFKVFISLGLIVTFLLGQGLVIAKVAVRE
jgi:intracellular septation protein